MLMFAFGNALACAHKLYGVRFYCNCCPVCLSVPAVLTEVTAVLSVFCLPLLGSDPTAAYLGSANHSSGSRDKWQNISIPGFPAQHNNA